MVLLYLWCFTLFDLGQYESNNDSGVLANSKMGQMFVDDLLHVPPDTKLQNDDLHDCPYFLLGDEIFPLRKLLMRPFPGKTADEKERLYNYQHSRARRVIENYFGILSARFRILQKPMSASPAGIYLLKVSNRNTRTKVWNVFKFNNKNTNALPTNAQFSQLTSWKHEKYCGLWFFQGLYEREH